MKKTIFTLAFAAAALLPSFPADRFIFSRDAATAGSSPSALPTQGVNLASGRVVVGLHALSDAERADCGWYRIADTTRPVAQSNEVWRVSGYTFNAPTNGLCTATWTCSWRQLPAKRYSKLDIITTLKSVNCGDGANAWARVKAAIESADLMDEWNAATYLAEDNPLFVAVKAQAAAITGLSEAQIAALLDKCIY